MGKKNVLYVMFKYPTVRKSSRRCCMYPPEFDCKNLSKRRTTNSQSCVRSVRRRQISYIIILIPYTYYVHGFLLTTVELTILYNISLKKSVRRRQFFYRHYVVVLYVRGNQLNHVRKYLVLSRENDVLPFIQ